jgi:serine O-acetyltransferase
MLFKVYPVIGNHVTIYSNSTLIGLIHVGDGATICGNVWLTHDVPAGETVHQYNTEN